MSTTVNNVTPETVDPKMGHFKKSWLLVKGSWKAFMLDKELASLPLISGLLSLIVFAAALTVGIINHESFATVVTSTDGGSLEYKWPAVVTMIIVGIITTGISMIFSGAIIYGALERFKGNDPTVRGSLRAAMKRGGSLLGFGLFSYAIGYILSYIAERIPFFGAKLIVWLASSAWNVASFFAVPVIVTSDKAMNPIEASKQSIALIKKTWGESLIISAGIGFIGVLTFIVWSSLYTGLLVFAGVGLHVSGWVIGGGAVFGLLSLVVLVLIFSALEAFAKAAIFHYATTGESPAAFDSRLMRQAFTQKKARKLFGA